jgi:hypothetical protein
MGDTENWSLDDLAAALRVAVDDFETFELAGADLLWAHDLAGVLLVLRADQDVVRPSGAQPVSSPGPAVR